MLLHSVSSSGTSSAGLGDVCTHSNPQGLANSVSRRVVLKSEVGKYNRSLGRSGMIARFPPEK
jgi:hypothetical protein